MSEPKAQVQIGGNLLAMISPFERAGFISDEFRAFLDVADFSNTPTGHDLHITVDFVKREE